VTGRHACEICGKKQTAPDLIYSRFTKSHYCRDFDACDRRKHRALRRQEQDREQILGSNDIEQRIAERVLRAAAGVGIKLPDEQQMMRSIADANHYAMKRESR
jgi:hypothetical protein